MASGNPCIDPTYRAEHQEECDASPPDPGGGCDQNQKPDCGPNADAHCNGNMWNCEPKGEGDDPNCSGIPKSCPDGQVSKCENGQWTCIDAGGGGSGDCPNGQWRGRDGTGPCEPAYNGDCPEGYTCDDRQPGCVCLKMRDNSSPAPAGGGGGGGKSSGGSSAWTSGIESLLEKSINDMLRNPGTRYTPEVMEALNAKAVKTREGTRQRLLQQTGAEFMKRGMYGAGGARVDGGDMATINRSVETDFASNLQKIQVEKINADYEDKITAIKLAQTNLDSTRDFFIRNRMADIDEKRIAAQMALGYANIDASLKTAAMNRDAAMTQFLIGMSAASSGYPYK